VHVHVTRTDKVPTSKSNHTQ